MSQILWQRFLMKMIDFDKVFEEYVLEWYKAHSKDYSDASELEENIPLIYDNWSRAASSLLGGVSPQAYFDSLSDSNLIAMLIDSCKNDGNPCSLLLDTLAMRKSCANALRQIIEESGAVTLKMTAINLLTEMEEAHPIKTYVSWLNNADANSDLVELAIEILCDNANVVSAQLYDLLPGANLSLKTIIAEILVNADKDERTFNLLASLFASGDNIPLYASYIGKYGDERASAMLYRALDTCNYLEYIEIKNAIERMGGVVDDTRDFTEDIYFKAIKNVK